jgi:hypothetical protein
MSHLGATERPFGSNTDGGGWIDQIQRVWGLHAVPWCGCAADAFYREANVDDSGIGNPGTSAMCQKAQANGWVWKKGPIPAGAWWISCGTHVETVVGDRGNGLVDNIGGNSNQSVRLNTRRVSDATIIIVPPAILGGTPEKIAVYGFEDLLLRPKRYGGWRTKAQREKVIGKLSPEVRKVVHRVNIGGKAPFAFVVYPRTNERWRLGPWDSKETRDRLMREYRSGHSQPRILRPYAVDINSAGGHGGLTTGDTTQ